VNSLRRKKWRVRVTTEVRDWLRELAKADAEMFLSVNAAIDELASTGPALGRPLVDSLTGSKIHNLKELRPRSGSRVAIRILFAFDPWSQAVLLLAGDKAGDWDRWYDRAIRQAEQRFAEWLVSERESRETRDGKD
jgi:hypothetical protein